jgi:uncharacterized membrane protein YedE/YeeE
VIRGIIGMLLCLAGAVWILQGLDILHGSVMSGRGGYTVLGAAVLLAGAVLIAWAGRRRSAGE